MKAMMDLLGGSEKWVLFCSLQLSMDRLPYGISAVDDMDSHSPRRHPLYQQYFIPCCNAGLVAGTTVHLWSFRSWE